MNMSADEIVDEIDLIALLNRGPCEFRKLWQADRDLIPESLAHILLIS